MKTCFLAHVLYLFFFFYWKHASLISLSTQAHFLHFTTLSRFEERWCFLGKESQYQDHQKWFGVAQIPIHMVPLPLPSPLPSPPPIPNHLSLSHCGSQLVTLKIQRSGASSFPIFHCTIASFFSSCKELVFVLNDLLGMKVKEGMC